MSGVIVFPSLEVAMAKGYEAYDAPRPSQPYWLVRICTGKGYGLAIAEENYGKFGAYA